jgi:hypothetical protein
MPLGCGCLFALAAASAPRLVLLFTWLFTSLVSRAFHRAFLVSLLGIIFLPFTMLMYVLAWQPVVGLGGWGWFFVIIGLLLDIGSYSGSACGNRNRLPSGYRAARMKARSLGLAWPYGHGQSDDGPSGPCSRGGMRCLKRPRC